MKLLTPSAFMLFLMMTFLLPNEALAHSALVSKTPDTTSTTEVSELTLTFNESIEPASSVAVTNEANEEQAVQDTTVKNKVMTVVMKQSLPNGVYTVNWKIISKDGHPAKGTYSFEINIPAPSPSATTAPSASTTEDAPRTSSSASPVQMTSIPSSPPVHEDADQTGSDFDLSKWLLFGASGLLIIAVAVSMMKKKKS